jgi:aerobic carbon-monoxide dehydrogenase large subunit
LRSRDTATTPYGIGTVGTNGAALAGSAVHIAGMRLREKVLAIAAHQFEVMPEDLRLANGRVHLSGVPDRTVALADVARAAYGGPGLPPGMELGLEASARFRQDSEPFSFGAFIAVSRVDRETGRVDIDRIIGVDDCGVVLNPLVLEGQTVGGVAFGLGQVMSERVVYDAAGQPLQRNFLDYAIPRATWMPPLVLDRTETPSPLNPLGAKGGAEGANIAVPAAIYNSVLDALAPLGVRQIDLPLVPENVWRAMASA